VVGVAGELESGGAAATARAAPFFGWWMVAVAFLGQGLAAGSTTYIFGLFVKPVAEEFGAERGPISLGMSLLTLSMGVIAPFLGASLDRHSIRAIMAAGGLSLGAGFALLSLAPSLLALGRERRREARCCRRWSPGRSRASAGASPSQASAPSWRR
jgi:hypothetical protein